ncbi:MAG: penicillin-binding protein 2, partial [Flavobacteriales bacterium]|nr:penicillin-binding protein 2 [Flavobacteriales bacterium]
MNLSNRKFIVALIFLVIGLIFIIRLFNIQILNEKYKADSDSNSVREIVQYPARGLIYDRNGTLLVFNEAAYDLMVVPRQVKEIDTVAFCQLLDISREEFDEKLEKAKSYSPYKPSAFVKEIS